MMHRLVFYGSLVGLLALFSLWPWLGQPGSGATHERTSTAFAAPAAVNFNGGNGNHGGGNGNGGNFNFNFNGNGDHHDNDNHDNDNDDSRNENDDGTNQNDDGDHEPRPRHEPRPSPPPPAPRPSSPPPPAAVGPCQFKLGFKTLHDILDNPAFGASVGTCTDNEFVDYATGNTLQPTTGGLFVYDPGRNLASFTNGWLTWINSPWGILQRPNTVRYCFEVVAGPCI